MTLSEKICRRRRELGLTQNMLGKRVGWQDSRIGIYERGEQRPTHKSLQKLAEALELDVKELEDLLR